MDKLEKFKLYKLHPLSKLILMLSIAIAVTARRELEVLIASLIFVGSIGAFGGIPRRFLKDLIPFAPFMLGIPAFNGLVAYLRNSDPLSPLVQSLLGILLLLFLSAIVAYTTTPDDFFYGIKRPYLISLLLTLAYSTLFILVRKAREILDAYKAKGLLNTPLDVLKIFKLFAISTLRSAFARAEALAYSLEQRTKLGPRRTYWRSLKFSKYDFLLSAISVLFAAILLAV